MNKKLKGNIILLLTAMIWGMGFVAQKAGAALEPFAYNGIRMLIGGLALLPAILVKVGMEKKTATEKRQSIEKSIKGGCICGLALFVASNLQQFGMYFRIDVGKAGFITSLYILFVPLISALFGKKIRPVIWACVGMGAVGFYLLTMAGSTQKMEIQMRDVVVLLCAVVFAIQIILVEKFSPDADGMILSATQFLITGILSMFCMLLFEHPSAETVISVWKPILFSGVISTGVGYTLQIFGQKYTGSTEASLLMSLESVFAVLFGVLLLKERMTLPEGVGCVIIFIAVVVAQVKGESNENG